MNSTLFHYVLFWLNPELSTEEVEGFKGFFEELRKISTVKELKVGVPAATEARGVVDNSFTYSLLVSFDSLEDHNAYQDDEIHNRAIEQYSRYWTKVMVHDCMLEN